MKLDTGGHYSILEALEMRDKTGFIGYETKRLIDETLFNIIHWGKSLSITPFLKMPPYFKLVEHPDGWFYMSIHPDIWDIIKNTDDLFDIKYLKGLAKHECCIATVGEVMLCNDIKDNVIPFILSGKTVEERQEKLAFLFHDYHQRDSRNELDGYLYDFITGQKYISDSFGKWLQNPVHKKHYDDFYATSSDHEKRLIEANFDWLGQYPNLRGE